MAALDRTDYSLSGLMPVVPRFDFTEVATIEAPASWDYMAAMMDYEQNVRPLHREWADRRGREVWERTKPWFCRL